MAFQLTSADKKVIDAFLDKKPASSKKLSTDGKSLDIAGMGGKGCCTWQSGKIRQHDLGSKTSEVVQRAVRKAAPKNWLEALDSETRERLEHLAEGYDDEEKETMGEVFTEEMRHELTQFAERMSDEARELKLYVDNDGQLYRQQTVPIIKNLMRKRAAGQYDPRKAAKLVMYLMDAGAKKYAKQFGSSGSKWNDVFSKKDRMQAAEDWIEDFEAEAEAGGYDDYIPKKYRKKREWTEATKGEDWSSADFCAEVQKRLSGLRDKTVRCSSSGLGSHEMAIVQFYNVPENKARGATGANNRAMFTVEGFGSKEGQPSSTGKVKLKVSVWSFSLDPWNVKRPRGATGAPAKILDKVVKIIKQAAQLEPKL